MPKLIDAEAAKAALEKILQFYRCTLSNFEKRGRTHQSYIYHSEGLVNGMEAAVAIIKALPDASEKAIQAERIPVPPHLADAQRVVIARALAAQPQEGE